MRRLLPLLVAVACLLGHGTATAAWTVNALGEARAVAGVLQPPTGLTVTPSCTATSTSTISYVGASSLANNLGTLTVPPPGGLAVGDLLVAHATNRFSSALSATGWTTIANDLGTPTHAVFHRWVTDPAASYTFTAGTAGNWVVNIVAYRGVDKVVPVAFPGGTVTGVQSSGGARGSGTTLQAPAITTTSANTWLVGFFGGQQADYASPAPSGTLRIATRSDRSGSDAQNVAGAIADRPVPAAGSTGTFSLTASKSSAYVAHVLALKPETFPEVTLAWSATTSAYATGYRLRRWVNGAVQPDVTLGLTTSHLSSPLQAGTPYSFEVSALAGSWQSTAASASHSATAC